MHDATHIYAFFHNQIIRHVRTFEEGILWHKKPLPALGFESMTCVKTFLTDNFKSTTSFGTNIIETDSSFMKNACLDILKILTFLFFLGRDCMDNVCQRLGLQQADLFGLRYFSRRHTYPKIR